MFFESKKKMNKIPYHSPIHLCMMPIPIYTLSTSHNTNSAVQYTSGSSIVIASTIQYINVPRLTTPDAEEGVENNKPAAKYTYEVHVSACKMPHCYSSTIIFFIPWQYLPTYSLQSVSLAAITFPHFCSRELEFL